MTKEELKAKEFREWARELMQRANDNAEFTDAAALPSGVIHLLPID